MSSEIQEKFKLWQAEQEQSRQKVEQAQEERRKYQIAKSEQRKLKQLEQEFERETEIPYINNLIGLLHPNEEKKQAKCQAILTTHTQNLEENPNHTKSLAFFEHLKTFNDLVRQLSQNSNNPKTIEALNTFLDARRTDEFHDLLKIIGLITLGIILLAATVVGFYYLSLPALSILFSANVTYATGEIFGVCLLIALAPTLLPAAGATASFFVAVNNISGKTPEFFQSFRTIPGKLQNDEQFKAQLKPTN